MDLETFISETLRQIVKGVKAAQEHEDCRGAEINPRARVLVASSGDKVPGDASARQVEFDVAVTVSEGAEKQGKGNIGVASILGIGGQASSNMSNTSVSRIKFSVPVVLPAK